MSGTIPILHRPDHGPASQQRVPGDEVGFQSTPVHSTLLTHAAWHAENVSAASFSPPSTFVLGILTQTQPDAAAEPTIINHHHHQHQQHQQQHRILTSFTLYKFFQWILRKFVLFSSLSQSCSLWAARSHDICVLSC